MKDEFAIVGIGETEFGTVSGVSTQGFHLLAIKAALADSGLDKSVVDGFIAQNPYQEAIFIQSLSIAEAMGIQPRYTADLNIGGATPVSMVLQAAAVIKAGLANVVVCSFGENARSGRKNKYHGRLNMGYEDFEIPYGSGAPVGYALAARRHMHEYGTTSKQLGAIAVAQRKHALINPGSQMFEPMTIEDHQNSPAILDPFRLLDCCLVSDGGGAVIVTSAERAKTLRQPPVYIMGIGSFHPHRSIMNAPTLTTCGAKISGQIAYRMAGITPKDIDFAELYDCFTYTVLVQIEDYGFCKKGEGGPFVETGRIEIGGELPVNTHGGLLSQAYMDGMFHITEAVKQLRGQCGERQVGNANIGLVSGNGGHLSTHATLILRR